MSPAIAARRPPPAAWPALFLALALAGCARPPAPLPPADGALVVALESAPLQYDPRLGTDQASSRLYELVYSGLLALDPAGALVPDLALGWEALDDGRRLRFHLRHETPAPPVSAGSGGGETNTGKALSTRPGSVSDLLKR
ncbi:MAG: hypothetical protein KBI26_08320, partial [Thermoanaerobaculia bacterium]|nr:hypothetical protein [Thermoanaerobaculia bacterium]